MNEVKQVTEQEFLNVYKKYEYNEALKHAKQNGWITEEKPEKTELEKLYEEIKWKKIVLSSFEPGEYLIADKIKMGYIGGHKYNGENGFCVPFLFDECVFPGWELYTEPKQKVKYCIVYNKITGEAMVIKAGQPINAQYERIPDSEFELEEE